MIIVLITFAFKSTIKMNLSDWTDPFINDKKGPVNKIRINIHENKT